MYWHFWKTRPDAGNQLTSASIVRAAARFLGLVPACLMLSGASRRKADLLACRGLDFRHDLCIGKTREVTQALRQRKGRAVGHLNDFGPVGRWQPRNEVDDIVNVTRLASEGAVGSQET